MAIKVLLNLNAKWLKWINTMINYFLGKNVLSLLYWLLYYELYKKDLHDPDNHDGIITQLEPDILKPEVKVGLRKHNYEQS